MNLIFQPENKLLWGIRSHCKYISVLHELRFKPGASYIQSNIGTAEIFGHVNMEAVRYTIV